MNCWCKCSFFVSRSLKKRNLFVLFLFIKRWFPVFVWESSDKLFGCLGTDLSFMVHKRSLSLTLLCTISYHCRVKLNGLSHFLSLRWLNFSVSRFVIKKKFIESMNFLLNIVYNVLTLLIRGGALQEMFVFLSRVLAKHTLARGRRGRCNIIIGYQNISHASHLTNISKAL